jgi:hypothetical protein
MTSPAGLPPGRLAPARRGRLALVSALALTAATVGAHTATAGETPRPGRPASVPAPLAAAPARAEAAVVLRREPQLVTGRALGGSTAPAWLRRSPGELPAEAAAAYLLAARTIHAVAPACQVSAPLLAGLGRVVSDHGRLAAGRAASDAVAADTDGGRIDHDPRADRPVGPMRMLPATWTAVGVDADGDGVRNPRDLDDAALAAAVYLCGAVLTGPADLRVDRALAAWDRTPGFAATAHRLARAYASDRYDAVWTAGQAVPVIPRARAVTIVTRHLAHPLVARGVAARTLAAGPHHQASRPHA